MIPEGERMYRFLKVLFSDNSERIYSIQIYEPSIFKGDEDKQWDLMDAMIDAQDRAESQLFAKLRKFGRDYRGPILGTQKELRRFYGDLRRFNGNHATGKGKKLPSHDPGPKAVRVLDRWMGTADSEPTDENRFAVI